MYPKMENIYPPKAMRFRGGEIKIKFADWKKLNSRMEK